MQITMTLEEQTAAQEAVAAWEGFIEDPQAPWEPGHPKFQRLARAMAKLREASVRRECEESEER